MIGRAVPPSEPTEMAGVLRLEAELAAAEGKLVQLHETGDRFDGRDMKCAADDVQRIKAELASRYGHAAAGPCDIR
jgi:hypothetical protein